VANPDTENSDLYTADKVNPNYVRWLESAGAESIVIHSWFTIETIDDILSKVNGVLFQGGSVTFSLNHQWEKNLIYIFEKAISFNKEGKYLPLWATCLGFEFINVIVAQTKDILTNFKAENILSPIFLVDDEIKSSKMFSIFSKSELINIQTESINNQNHKYGISLSQYDNRPELNQFYRITSTARDLDDKTYIATVEAREFPIYGVQFHPEKTPFDRNPQDVISQTVEAIEISQRFAQFFVSEARKNDNSINEADKLKYDFVNTLEKGNKNLVSGYFIYPKPSQILQ
jgi:gamma-glutamyl hydrolase